MLRHQGQPWKPLDMRWPIVSHGKGNGKGLVCHCMTKTLGSPSSDVSPFVVLVYGDVNMIGVDFVKATKACVPGMCPQLTPLWL